LIAKRIEREKEKKCKIGATQKQEKHKNTLSARALEGEKREKSETKKLPKNSSSFFCSSLQKRVIIFHSRHLSYSFITYLKRVFIPSSTTTTTIIPLYYRNDDSDDVRRESKQY
jgi:beta-glucanase (GH16 family)